MGGWGDDDVPESPEEAARRRRVAENGTRLHQRTAELIAGGLKNPAAFEITVAVICELNGIAVAGEDCDPGVLRTREVQIAERRDEEP